MSLIKFLDNKINSTARQPFKNANLYNIPKGKSFFQWLEEINDKPTLEELEREKIDFDHQQSLINS